MRESVMCGGGGVSLNKEPRRVRPLAATSPGHQPPDVESVLEILKLLHELWTLSQTLTRLQTMSEAGRMWLSSFTGQEEDNIQILPLKLSPTLGQWCGQIITSVYIHVISKQVDIRVLPSFWEIIIVKCQMNECFKVQALLSFTGPYLALLSLT